MASFEAELWPPPQLALGQGEHSSHFGQLGVRHFAQGGHLRLLQGWRAEAEDALRVTSLISVAASFLWQGATNPRAILLERRSW